MKTTIELLNALAAKHREASDYRLAKILGVAKQTISRYRTGKGYLDEAIAIKVADQLGLERGYVLACIAAERATSDAAKAAWKKIAATAAALVVALALAPDLEPGALIATADAAPPLYIMSNTVALILAAIGAAILAALREKRHGLRAMSGTA